MFTIAYERDLTYKYHQLVLLCSPSSAPDDITVPAAYELTTAVCNYCVNEVLYSQESHIFKNSHSYLEWMSSLYYNSTSSR